MSDEPKYTLEEWNNINEQLKKQLGPEYLTQRPGPGGRSLTYIEGKTAITIANDIFGFNGWSTLIKEVVVDFCDVGEDGRVSIGVAVTVRITLKDGTYHEDQGYGSEVNAKTKAQAFEKARKQGVTDATKRALRYFGNALGNCLYDNPYLGGIGKMAKPQIKFIPKNLYRHEQFQTPRVEVTPPSHQIETSKPSPPRQVQQIASSSITKPSPPVQSTTNGKQKQIEHKQEPKPEPKPEVQESRQSLKEPIIPEDSFSYEGDDEFFAQICEVNEIDFNVADEIEDEILAGIISPPPQNLDHTIHSFKREAPLSDFDDDLSINTSAVKKQKA